MKNFLLYIGIALSFFCDKPITPPQDSSILVIGKIVDRPKTEALHLVEQGGDYRISFREILVRNGSFSFEIPSNEQKRYSLAYKDELDMGSWMDINFFTDADTIRLMIYDSERFDENKVVGGKLNAKRNEYYKRVAILNSNYDQLYDSRLDEKTRDAKIEALSKEFKKFEKDLITKDQTIFGYALLLEGFLMYNQDRNGDPDFLETSVQSYHQKYPNHTYTLQTKNLLSAIKSVKVGGKYVDFSAPDKNGNLVQISSIVENNKVTLLDLWTPWCAPCIRKSRELAPHYFEFKKRGFEAVGVLSGIDHMDKYYDAILRFPNPWNVLVEVDSEFKIYEKYNIGGQGGSQFLIDQSGTILAINPSVTEIDKFLK